MSTFNFSPSFSDLSATCSLANHQDLSPLDNELTGDRLRPKAIHCASEPYIFEPGANVTLRENDDAFLELKIERSKEAGIERFPYARESSVQNKPNSYQSIVLLEPTLTGDGLTGNLGIYERAKMKISPLDPEESLSPVFVFHVYKFDRSTCDFPPTIIVGTDPVSLEHCRREKFTLELGDGLLRSQQTAELLKRYQTFGIPSKQLLAGNFDFREPKKLSAGLPSSSAILKTAIRHQHLIKVLNYLSESTEEIVRKFTGSWNPEPIRLVQNFLKNDLSEADRNVFIGEALAVQQSLLSLPLTHITINSLERGVPILALSSMSEELRATVFSDMGENRERMGNDNFSFFKYGNVRRRIVELAHNKSFERPERVICVPSQAILLPGVVVKCGHHTDLLGSMPQYISDLVQRDPSHIEVLKYYWENEVVPGIKFPNLISLMILAGLMKPTFGNSIEVMFPEAVNSTFAQIHLVTTPDNSSQSFKAFSKKMRLADSQQKDPEAFAIKYGQIGAHILEVATPSLFIDWMGGRVQMSNDPNCGKIFVMTPIDAVIRGELDHTTPWWQWILTQIQAADLDRNLY